ncbi:MAG: glycosyltransferase [Planctomycetes bacterium]|nr:glycosyltransferase [Planctomycetota bacterium]MBI3843110.1 glycosyltransferase [Planctomycetota bacterium]
MRTLHLNTERTWRGGEQQTLYLVQGLLRRGHAADLVCQPGGELAQRARAAGATVLEIPMRGETDLRAVFRIARRIRDVGYDVIHMHTSHAHTLGCLSSLAARMGRRVVSRRVDFSIYRHPFSMSGLKYKHGVDRFIAISHAVQAALVADGVPAERISIVASGVDPERLRGVSGAGVRAELHVPDGAPLVVNVAHLAWHKAQEFLVRAVPALLADIPDARIVIVGDGERRGLLEREIRDLGVERSVILAGFRADASRFMAAANVFVMPSVMEGLCTSILDALLLERPVVASRAGGMPEIVEDGMTGWLVPPKDPAALASAIVASLRDPERAARLARQGRERVLREFTADAMVEGTLRVYRELVPASATPEARRVG